MDGERLRAALKPRLEQCGLDLEEILSERDALDSSNASEREIVIAVVGTGRAPGLERMIRFLAEGS